MSTIPCHPATSLWALGLSFQCHSSVLLLRDHLCLEHPAPLHSVLFYPNPSSSAASSEKPFLASEETLFSGASMLSRASWRLSPQCPPAVQLFVYLGASSSFPLKSHSIKDLLFLMYVSFIHCMNSLFYGEPWKMIYIILLEEREEPFWRWSGFHMGHFMHPSLWKNPCKRFFFI